LKKIQPVEKEKQNKRYCRMNGNISKNQLYAAAINQGFGGVDL
jgi:hypothetical protein